MAQILQNITIFHKYKDRNSPLFISRISVFFLFFSSILIILLGYFSNLFILKSFGFLLFVEFLSSYLTFKSLSYVIREPDYVFNYGFGKYESFSIFLSAILISNLLVFLFAFGFNNFDTLYVNEFFIIFCLGVILVFSLALGQISKYQLKYYKRFNLENLLNSYVNLKQIIFFCNSLLFGLALILALNHLKYNTYIPYADIFFSILLSIFFVKEPFSKLSNAVDQLMDKKLPEHIQFDLIGIIAENLNRMCKFNAMHTRQSGDDLFIELDIILPWKYTIEQKYNLEKDLKSAILEKYPKSIIRVYVLPCSGDCTDSNGCSNCPINRKK